MLGSSPSSSNLMGSSDVETQVEDLEETVEAYLDTFRPWLGWRAERMLSEPEVAALLMEPVEQYRREKRRALQADFFTVPALRFFSSSMYSLKSYPGSASDGALEPGFDSSGGLEGVVDGHLSL